MIVRFLQNVRTSNREIPAGTILDIEGRHLETLGGVVQPIGEVVAACRIDGDICQISYAEDMYQAQRHRDGEVIDLDGVPVRLVIEKMPA